MRVTDHSNFDMVRDAVQRSRDKMNTLQIQSVSMKKINTPSDDPVGTAKVLEVRTDRMNNDQYQMNSKMAETFLENTDSALAEVSELVLRAKEIALGQSNSATASDHTRLGVAEEVAQIFKQAIAVANRRVGDRYLFGGFKTQKPPIDADGRYHGDRGQMMVEIAKDVFLTMNIPGSEAFNTNAKPEWGQDLSRFNSSSEEGVPSTEGSLENVNLFDELQNFRIALLTGNMEMIHDSLDRFDQLYSKIVSTRTKLGSRLQGLASSMSMIDRQNLTNINLSSVLEDADMAHVSTELNKEESIFKNSLMTSKRLIQPSLLDFLR
ncbi:MAG: flagellar hook-associated protein FlgL [Bdellovibrionia bacterium]